MYYPRHSGPLSCMASGNEQAIETAPSSHRRFTVNVAASLASLVISVLVGLWYTPYMIRHLGVAVYGLLPLANSITNYMTILTIAVCATVARYITMDLARNDVENANRHFNTFLVVGTAMAAALFAFAYVFSSFLPRFFKIPAGQEQAAKYVFLGVAGSFLISTIANTFQSSIWVANRFEVRSLIEASLVLARAGLIVLSFRIWAPALWQVSIIIPLVAIFGLVADVAACRILVPSLRFRLSDYDRTKLPDLWSTSQWLLLSQLGNLLFVNIDLVVINIVMGPVASGRYAPLLQWVVLLRMLMGTITSSLSPPILVRYARGEMEALLRLSKQASKFLGLMIALPAGLLTGFAKPMLGTWLGPAFPDLSGLTWLLLVPMAVEAAQNHFGNIVMATNKLRAPVLATLAFGVGNVVLAVLFTRYLGWGLYGVAAAGAITSLGRNGIFSPLYTAYMIDLHWSVFLKNMASSLAAALALAAAAAVFSPLVRPGSWIRLGIGAAPLAVAYAGLMYFFALNDEERLTLRKIALSSLRLPS